MKIKSAAPPKIVKLPHILYSIEWYVEPTKQDIMAYENACRRYAKKYPHISWFLAVSTTASKYAKKIIEKTGLRGRPKTKVEGEKINKHVHQGAIGSNDQSAWSFQKDVANFLNKRAGKRVTKVVSMRVKNAEGKILSNGARFIKYSYNQADSFHQGGDFDFREIGKAIFIEEF